jgi:hypothetical protein
MKRTIGKVLATVAAALVPGGLIVLGVYFLIRLKKSCKT